MYVYIYIYDIMNYTGCWLTYPSEKYVKWDDDIPNIWKNKNVQNHQPGMCLNTI